MLSLLFSGQINAYSRNQGTISDEAPDASRKDRYASVKPILKHRMLIIHIHRVDARFTSAKGSRLHAKRTIRKSVIARSLRYGRDLGRYIARQTRGKVRMEFGTVYLKAVVRNLVARTHQYNPRTTIESRSPVLETMTTLDGKPFDIGRFFMKRLKKWDSFAFFWPIGGMATAATGGGGTYPIVPYQLYSTIRGIIFYPSHYRYSSIFLHEFFHSIEGMYGISPVHGYMKHNRHKFPVWTGRGEFAYYKWQFRTTIRRKGYHLLNWRLRWPHTISRAAYLANLAVARKVPIARRRRAYEIMRKSDKLWRDKRKPAALKLALQARRFNPWNISALHRVAFHYTGHKAYRTAVPLLEELKKLQPVFWRVNYLGSLYLWHLKQSAKALAVFRNAAGLARTGSEKGSAFFNQGRALRRLRRYPQAMAFLKKSLAAYTNKQHHIGPLWEMGDCLYAQNRKNPRYITEWKKAAALDTTAWRWRSIGWHEYGKFKRYKSALASYGRSLSLTKRNKEKADARWHMGMIHKRLKQYWKARKQLRIAATRYSKYTQKASAYWEIGNCLLKANPRSPAYLKAWRRAIAYSPSYGRWRGVAWHEYTRFKRYYRALAAYRKTLSYCRDRKQKADIYWHMAHINKRLKRYNRAIRHFKKSAAAYKRKTSQANALWEIGNCYYTKNNKFNAPFLYWLKSVQLHSVSWRWKHIGHRYTGLKLYNRAIMAFKKAVILYKKARDKASCHWYLAFAYYYQKAWNKAIKEFRKAAALYSKKRNKASCYRQIAHSYRRRDRHFRQGIIWFLKACGTWPTASIWKETAWYQYSSLKQYGLAKKSYQRALSLAKKAKVRADILLNLGRICIRQKQPRKALGFINRCLRLKSNRSISSAAFWEKGNAFYGINKNHGEKLLWWKRAVILKPDRWRWWNIGNTYQWNLKQYKNAIITHRRSLSFFKSRDRKSMVWARIGRAEMDRGRITAAKRAFNTAFRYFPRGKRGGEALFWQGYLYGHKLKNKRTAVRLIRRAMGFGYTSRFVKNTLKHFQR